MTRSIIFSLQDGENNYNVFLYLSIELHLAYNIYSPINFYTKVITIKIINTTCSPSLRSCDNLENDNILATISLRLIPSTLV